MLTLILIIGYIFSVGIAYIFFTVMFLGEGNDVPPLKSELIETAIWSIVWPLALAFILLVMLGDFINAKINK